MREYGIIYHTGDIFRVAIPEIRACNESQDGSVNYILKYQAGYEQLGLDLIGGANYVVDLATGQEIKNRNPKFDCWQMNDVMDPNIRYMFLTTTLLNREELQYNIDIIDKRVRKFHDIDAKIKSLQLEIANLLVQRNTI